MKKQTLLLEGAYIQKSKREKYKNRVFPIYSPRLLRFDEVLEFQEVVSKLEIKEVEQVGKL